MCAKVVHQRDGDEYISSSSGAQPDEHAVAVGRTIGFSDEEIKLVEHFSSSHKLVEAPEIAIRVAFDGRCHRECCTHPHDSARSAKSQEKLARLTERCDGQQQYCCRQNFLLLSQDINLTSVVQLHDEGERANDDGTDAE